MGRQHHLPTERRRLRLPQEVIALLSATADLVDRFSWAPTIVGGLLIAFGSYLATDHGWGIAILLLGACLEVIRQLSKQTMDKAQRDAAARFRIAVKTALRPVTERIARMPQMTPAKRRDHLHPVAEAVPLAVAQLLDVEGLRVVVYALNASEDSLEPLAYGGGGGHEPGQITRREDGRNDSAFALLESGKTDYCPDTAKTANPEDYEGRPYRTYASIPIKVRDLSGWGLLNIDAPLPKSLTDNDIAVVEYVALLIAVAFASAEGSGPT